MSKVLFAMYVVIFFSLKVFSHGEDKPGPNAGYVRMPSGFHTELVPKGANQFYVYLLDINWKNPSVKNSSVGLVYNNSGEKMKADCVQKSNYYECRFLQKIMLNHGSLELTAMRESMKAPAAIYELPLSFDIKTDMNNAHKKDAKHGAHH